MSTNGDDLADGQGSIALAAQATNFHAATTAPTVELVVRQSIEPGDLHRLFECLLHEDCVHSWRDIGPKGRRTVEGLVKWENRRRPTQLFFFYAERGGRLRIVAASAVAERLTHDFPYPGFCVLTRCYIMPEFRGQGFYRRVLHHRLEYCKARFGDGLRGVHIGTSDERIARAITTHSMPSWPRFIHLGKEELRVAGQIRTVGDYMLLVPEYVHRLQRALAGANAPVCVTALRDRLLTLNSPNISNLGVFIKKRFEEACLHGWFDERDTHDLEQLLLFCRSIPLIGFR